MTEQCPIYVIIVVDVRKSEETTEVNGAGDWIKIAKDGEDGEVKNPATKARKKGRTQKLPKYAIEWMNEWMSPPRFHVR